MIKVIKENLCELDHEIIPETHPPMYLMHKYWARKPANIVAEYIRKYSLPNDIIYDPFMGSGVTVIESLILGRRAIGVDINPLAHFITKNTGIYGNIEELKTTFSHLERIIKSPEGLYAKLYLISCPICQQSAELTHIIWDKIENCTLHQIIEIRILCSKCGEIITSKTENANFFANVKKNLTEQEDMALKLLALLHLTPPSFNFNYQNAKPFLQLRHDLRKNNSIQNLFSNRNFAFLTYLYDIIDKLEKISDETKDLVRFIFTSALGQASKMVWVIDKRKGKHMDKRQVGSWTHHFFWDPTTFFEVNAWNCFVERFEKIVKGKINSNIRFQDPNALRFSTTLDYTILTSQNPVLLIQDSSKRIAIPSDSVDFIFTDPPYGDSIQYGELSTFWAAWIGLDMQSYLAQIQQNEITMNSRQEKTLERYQQELTTIFREAFRVLKFEKYMVVTFHNTDFKIRNAIITAILDAGFTLCQILHQMPPRVSVKSMLHYEGSPVGDYYIRFQKATPISNIQQANLSEDQIQKLITARISEILTARGEPTSFLWITNFLDEFLAQQHLFPLPQFELIITNIRLTGEFIVDQKAYWWFSAPETKKLEIPLSDRIQKRINELLSNLNSNNPKSKSKNKESPVKQRIFNLLYQEFKGIYTPDKFFIGKLIDNGANSNIETDEIE